MMLLAEGNHDLHMEGSPGACNAVLALRRSGGDHRAASRESVLPHVPRKTTKRNRGRSQSARAPETARPAAIRYSLAAADDYLLLDWFRKKSVIDWAFCPS
jgi:hypothetical protein